MANNKQWYNVYLFDSIENKEQIILKVKSLGLAYLVAGELKKHPYNANHFTLRVEK